MWICVFWANKRQLLGVMACSWHSEELDYRMLHSGLCWGDTVWARDKRGSLLEDVCLRGKDLERPILELYFVKT